MVIPLLANQDLTPMLISKEFLSLLITALHFNDRVSYEVVSIASYVPTGPPREFRGSGSKKKYEASRK